MRRIECFPSDMDEVGPIFAGIDDNIEMKSLADCLILEKFNLLNKKSRPILARLARPIDIQSKHNNLGGKISIRSDLSRQERDNK